jgi:succinyl-diaminopimelate desuccinylase
VILVQIQRLFSEIERLRNEMTETLMELIRVPAMAPENGGEGELEKAERLNQTLKAVGFDRIERYDSPDNRVPSGKRPNIVAYMRGETEAEILWIVSHLDVVPPGEESLWTIVKPFEPAEKEGKVYGRGSEDNGQSMVASILAAKALRSLGIRPKRTIALCFVADEEQGSRHGIRHLIRQGLFKRDDLVVVPDGGKENGAFVEIAEKSILWLRVRTIGKQTHASTPDLGLNANRIGMQYALALDKLLHKKYRAKDRNFDPPTSTFEPTRRDKNVEALNIIPGEDVSHFDCRILPRYDTEELVGTTRELALQFEKQTGAKITVDVVQKTIAPKPTDPNAKAVVMLKKAIRKVRAVKPKVGGIGGGTCAAYFREIGIPAVVWSTVDELAHQPNEYSRTQNLVDDAKVFAYLAIL